MGYLELLNEIKVEFREFSYELDYEAQKEEKKFLIAVASSVRDVGKWCLSLVGGYEGALQNNADLRSQIEMITFFLVDRAIDLLDTDKCEIGFPVVDLLINWVQSYQEK